MKKRLVSLVLLATVLASLFTFTSSGTASAHALTGGCWGVTCYTKDPSAYNCTGNVVFYPYNKPEYYNGVLVGYLSSVYSYDCNSNWAQASLTSYAISQGWTLVTTIYTFDSLGHEECTNYPLTYPPGYNGASGWPVVTDMVDGTNVTYSSFKLYNGWNQIFSDTVQQ